MPLTTVEGHPPAESQGDSAGPPHSHTRTHSARVAGPGSPPSRRAAGEGEAPALRRSPQRRKAPPWGRPSAAPTVRNGGSQGHHAVGPELGPPPAPRHAAPTGHVGQGDSVGPPHPHTRAHSTWAADPGSPPGQSSRRRESAWLQTPLATGPPVLHGRQGEHLVPTRLRERRPAGPAFELPYPRPTAPKTRAPATGNPQPIPCS